MIRFFEELCLSALPALETMYLDGWVLRFGDGYNPRANSINPLYLGTRSLEENLREAEALLRGRGQRVVFKLTPASLPAGLDEALAERGYAREAVNSVQTLDIRSHPAPAQLPNTIAEGVTDDWVAAASTLNGVPELFQPTLRQMFSRLAQPVCFAALRVEGQPVTVGRGVLQSGYVGLFDGMTRPALRGRGHARQVINDMLDWGAKRGAHTAYLYVQLDNTPAFRLYEWVGFREAYQFWYRVKV